MRLIKIFALAASLATFSAAASADPITDVLSGSDGNFGFSVIHTSSSGGDGQSGSITHDVSLNTLNGANVWDAASMFYLDLTARSGGAVSTYEVVGEFDIADLSDGSFDGDYLVGKLTFSVISGDAFLDGSTFYFEDRGYSSAGHQPNSQSGSLVTLWGATNYDTATSTPTLGSAFDLIAGGVGIDLRLELGSTGDTRVVPEPGTYALFGLAALGYAIRRRKQNETA